MHSQREATASMPQHISAEKLKAIAESKKELSRREFDHIHVCSQCLQAYAKAIRQRAKKDRDKGKGMPCESSERLILSLVG
jgi:hypothetical protein